MKIIYPKVKCYNKGNKGNFKSYRLRFCINKIFCWFSREHHRLVHHLIAIKSVNPKGNQSWIFIARTDAEAETQVPWPPEAKNWLIGKDPDAGKDWRQEEKGMTEDEMVGWHHWWTWVWAHSRSWWWTGKPGLLQSMGWQRIRHDWATELN